MQRRKAVARRLNGDAGAAIGLIIGIILGSALLNALGPLPVEALASAAASAKAAAAELLSTGTIGGR